MAWPDRETPIRFLSTGFEPNDWIAILLKSSDSGDAIQRVGPISWAQSERLLRWLQAMNARRFNVFVGINSIAAGRRSRTRDAIDVVRHVFLDVDEDGAAAMSRLTARRDLPAPSYVVHTSPSRVHVFWRVKGFDQSSVEQLQRQLAREIRTDPAATPVTQTTRLPGFFNYKRARPHLVSVDYLDDIDSRYTPDDFPAVCVAQSAKSASRPTLLHAQVHSMERARRYLASVPPAIAGQHGDVQTFRVCCRLVRGFALNEEQALEALAEWNARCEPPWSSSSPW